MKTKQEIIAELKVIYPTLRTGSEEEGYINLTQAEYNAVISEWADNKLADEAKAQAEKEAAAKKLAAEQKLATLGLTADDLKALGLA